MKKEEKNILGKYQYINQKNRVVTLERNEIPYRRFVYFKNDEPLAIGTKREISKKLNITVPDLNSRIYNYRKGRSRVKHSLMLIEED